MAGLFDLGFTAEHQSLPAAAAQIASALLDQRMALGGKREAAVRTRAAVDVARGLAAVDGVGMAAIGRQFVHTTHDQLPFFAMGCDAVAKQLMSDQMRDFVGHGLLEEVFAVFAVQLRVEAQQVLMQMGDPGFLPAQLEADQRTLEGALEKHFGLLETVLDAGVELLGHAVRLSRAAIMPQSGEAENLAGE